MEINLIACIDNNYGIGKNNDIPWLYKTDLEYFKYYTTHTNDKNKKNIVIMGNNTFKSIPEQFKPLKNRVNIILTNNKNHKDSNTNSSNKLENNILYFNDIISILYFLDNNQKNINKVWIIGGSYIYKYFLELHIIKHIYLTVIPNNNFNCDVYFPHKYLKYFTLIESKIEHDYNTKSYSINKDELQFMLYQYVNKDENNYLYAIKKILIKGEDRLDRTGVGTKSLFGKTFKYNIRNYRLPLFTHRKMFYRGIIEELLFFISGNTNTKYLESKKINIWKGNTSREFLDSRNLNHLKEGDMGAGYSFQLRYFGAEYINAETDYINKGFDQLKYVIDLIKSDPYSRRILFSYWNPKDLNKVALPSCFVKDTLVLTKNGYKEIQKITLEDKVYTHLGQWQEVTEIHSYRYNDYIYYISCEYNNKYIKTTKDHPFYVVNNIGDKPYWCKAEDLNYNHMLCVPINRENKLIELIDINNNSNTITIDDCYIFGYYLYSGYSDGSDYNLILDNNHSDDILYSLINLTNKEVLQYDNCKYTITDYKYSNYLNLFGETKYKKKIPEWIIDLPSNYLLHFINGFAKNKNKYKIYSKTLAYSLQRIYAKLNTYLSITFYNQPNKFYQLEIINNYQLDPYYQYFKIQKILQNKKNINVYNLEVNKDNSYIVQNVIVHNCHILYQFYINKAKNELSCSFYQRSSDFVLAANFNIVSASILTFMLCHITGYKPGKIIHNIGDIHIYNNHIEETKKMLNNIPNNFPICNIYDPEEKIKKIEDFTYDNFKILLYNSYSKYNFTMAV